jgi:hypothetical protein
MKVAKHHNSYRACRVALQICICIVVFGLMVSLRVKIRGDKIVIPWYESLLLNCVGGMIIWVLGGVIANRRMEKGHRRKTVHPIHLTITNSPRGIKTCPYCGAEYAGDATICATDHSDLVLK